MRWLVVGLMVGAVGCTGGMRSRHILGWPNVLQDQPLPPDQWFTQRLDHFSPTDSRTWQQRYQMNDSFWEVRSNGPVFLMIGGEGEATPKWLVQGAWIGYAKEYGALCFQLEHRFYGKSRPTEDMSTENLKFLSSEQALEDLAYFIESMNKKFRLGRNNKWVAFGGSYPGSLAAWLRLKYPHLVHAAVSTSGPLLAKADFTEYFDVVTKSLGTYSKECSNNVREASKQVKDLLKTQNGTDLLSERLKLCSVINPDNDKDVNSLFEAISNIFADVVQYNKDNRMSKSATSNITIDDICLSMVDVAIGDPFDRLSRLNSDLLQRQNEPCLDYSYDKSISAMKEVSWNSSASEGGRQWFYQTCTEFGWYQTSEKDNHLFGPTIPLKFYTDQCKDIFGDAFDDTTLANGIKSSNINYGSLQLQVSRVVFVHGSIDPWHAMGITSSSNGRAPAIYIPGTAHCANMYPPAETDPPALTHARWRISKLIGKWLLEGHQV